MRTCTAKLLLAIVPIAAAALPVFSQAPGAARPSFDVASIKPNTSGSGNSGTSTRQGRIFATNVSVKQLIRQAYSLQNFQIVGGPGWIDADRYDIEAKAEDGAVAQTPPGPPDPNKPNPIALMMQSLLEDRFQLKLHRETRELPVYTLSIAKDGSKMKLSAEQNPGRGGPPERGAGPPPAPGGPAAVARSLGAGNMNTSVNRVTGEVNGDTVEIARLVSVLAGQLGRTVIDKTELKGFFDIHLQWAVDAGAGAAPGAPADPAGPSLFTALQEQLGLKLDSGKGPVEVLIIDSVQKPSEN